MTGKPLKRASAKRVVPQKSKVVEVKEAGPLADPITLEVDGGKPIAFLENPEEVIPHDRVPEKIKRAVIDTYGEKFFTDKEWTRGQLIRLGRAIVSPRENLTRTIAQICGTNCTMMDLCPYDIAGRAPTSERCPIELKIAERLYEEYVIAVSERLKIEPKDIKADIILHNLINGIVEADMVEARLNGAIAKDGFIIEVPTVVNEQTGEVFSTETESVAVRIKERVAKRKDQLFRQLLVTPEMAAKYKRKGDMDNVARGAKLLDKLERFLEDKTQISGETIE